jgi:hypothetical protein
MAHASLLGHFITPIDKFLSPKFSTDFITQFWIAPFCVTPKGVIDEAY